MRALIVDDSTQIRARLGALLREEGAEVREASSGEEALALLAAVAFDIVVLDLRMPGMSGLALLPRLRAARPQAKLLMLTNHPTEHHRRQALALGADFFLDKARDFDRLPALMAELAGKLEGA